MKQSLHKILNSKVNRKEFLVFIGLSLASITGISGLLERLNTALTKPTTQQGYGDTTYGGK